jgi:hypothetical protein
MIGTERKRYCGECKLNVYNISGMTRTEAETLLIQSEGRLCVRYYRRADGTILTKDCPVGWAKVKERVSRVATAAFSLLMTLFAGIGIMSVFSKNEKQGSGYEMGDYPLMGAVAISNSNSGPVEPWQGKAVMGNVALLGSQSDISAVEMGEVPVQITRNKRSRN